ncbi:MAG: NAD(P)/FAD-dependent oxidoreductase [Hyphomicrobiales bacterium]|nr:NAD(P)/FAD-dependent oxidoreductase [Hyphomicrobiales bacterium]
MTPERFDIDVAVIGAGVIGLAAARALAQAGREVLVFEATGAIGSGISSRNSEVVHAGIYYPKGSVKARSCLRGKELLYAYAERHHVPHRRCGKLIVAVDAAQEVELGRIAERARANGVDDLEWLSREQALRLEPELRCKAALISPSTGIIDAHAYMLALRGDVEAAGGSIVFESPVAGGAIDSGRTELTVGGASPSAVAARLIVNAAGLAAPVLLDQLTGFPAAHRRPRWFAKGNYFKLSGRPPFKRLIYPVPNQAGLGVHATLDLAGQVRFGPDVEWITDEHDFAVDPGRAEIFYKAVRSYWPGLADGALAPDYAGIRPKLVGPGEPAADFVIQGPQTHGVLNLINLLGIESPGLTSALAIAELVQDMAEADSI